VTDLLCANQACHITGRHLSDCPGDDCWGCQPARAADGLWICGHCTRRIGTDAIEAARLHGELALVLAGTGGGGPRVSGGGLAAGIALNTTAAEIRAEIRHVLVAWTLLCAQETNWTPPADRVTAIAAWIDLHREWYAGRDFAGEISREMAELVRAARPVAYPSGTRRFSVGGCPRCGADLVAILRRETSLLPQELVCAEDTSHTWTRAQWLALGDQLRERRPVEPDRVPLRSVTVGHGGWDGRRVA
jgi:hypothetical protein